MVERTAESSLLTLKHKAGGEGGEERTLAMAHLLKPLVTHLLQEGHALNPSQTVPPPGF